MKNLKFDSVKKNLILLLALLFVPLYAQEIKPMQQPQQSPTSQKFIPPVLSKKKKDTFLEQFNKTLDQVFKTYIPMMTTLLKEFPTQLKNYSFEKTTTINLLTKDPSAPAKQSGIIIYLLTPGYGDTLNGFTGVYVDIRLDSLEDSFRNTAVNVSKQVISYLVMGKTTKDKVTGFTTLKTHPLMEFFVRLGLLVKDMPTLGFSTFNANLFRLMIKFVNTPEMAKPEQALEKLPPFIAPILKSVKIEKKTVYDHIQHILVEMGEIFTYDFSQSNNRELDVKDFQEIIKIALAIPVQALVQYGKAFESFSKTPTGILAIKKAKETGTEQLFFKQIPEMGKIRNQILSRGATLVQRLKFFRILRPKLIAALKPIIDPLLAPIGVTLDQILPAPGEEEALSAEDKQLLAQADDLLGANPFVVQPTITSTTPTTGELPKDLDQHITQVKKSAETQPTTSEIVVKKSSKKSSSKSLKNKK